MTNPVLEEYFAALERLKQGMPRVVKKGAKINNDSVSIEAGRQKGSIKKSREQFSALISAIDAAAAVQTRPQVDQVKRLVQAKQTSAALRAQLDAALAREISLLAQLYDLKKKLVALTGEKVLPIRSRS